MSDTDNKGIIMTKTLRVGMTFLVAVFGWVNAAGALEVAGIVVDKAGQAVAEARVVARSPIPAINESLSRNQIKTLGETQSGADGHFSIALPVLEVQAWELQLVILHPKYGFTTLSPRDLFMAGKTLTECRVVLPDRGFIKGKVVDSSGKPVKDAEITTLLVAKRCGEINSYPRLLDKSVYCVTTGADGAFLLDGLPQSASVILCATHSNYATGFTGLSGNEGGMSSVVTVGTTEVRITLQPGATVEGKITLEGTEIPVGHMSVIASSGNGGSAFIGMTEPVETDEKGDFSFRNLAPGKYTIQALNALPEGILIPREVMVDKPIRMTGQNLTVTKGVRIAGKMVRADNGEPVGGGNVVIHSNNARDIIQLKAKSDGTFDGRVMPGEATLQARIQGAAVMPVQVTRFFVSGQDQTDFVFMVKPSMIFKGHVLDPDGKPIAGARVFSGGMLRENPIVTNQEGIFEFPLQMNQFQQMEPNPYLFEAVHPDKPGLRGVLYKSFAREIDLTGDIKLLPTGTIQGRIIWEGTGEPIPNVLVTTSNEESDQLGVMASNTRAVSDDQGVFSVTNLIPGRYILRVSSFNEGLAYPRKVEVAQAASVTGQDLVVSKGVRIAGKFVNSVTKEPIAGGRIWGRSKSSMNTAVSFVVKADGRFEGRMMPGGVTLEANFGGKGYLRREQAKIARTLIAGQDQTDIVYEVDPYLLLKGRVLDNDGKPIAGAWVTVKRSDGGNGWGNLPVVSNRDGFFEVPLPFNINKHGETMLVLNATHPEKPNLRGLQKKSMMNDTDLSADIIMMPMSSIQGKITWEGTAKPAPGIVVSAVANPSEHVNLTEKSRRVISDEAGNYLIKDLMPGRYILGSFSTKAGVVLSRYIEVGQNEQKMNQDLTAIKGVRISGKFIKAGTQDPADGGSVYVSSTDYNTISPQVEVKGDGTFEFFMVHGNVVLQASVQGGFLPQENAQRKLTLLAGQEQANVIFEVNPLGIFRGRVLDVDGKPVSGARIFPKANADRYFLTSNQEGCFEVPLYEQRHSRNESTAFFSFVVSHPDTPDRVGVFSETIDRSKDFSADITLMPAGTLQGKVLWKETGEPVKYVTVIAVLKATGDMNLSNSTKQVMTDDTGMFMLNGLFPGHYTLKVDTFDDGVVIPMPIDIAPGEKRMDVSLPVIKGVRVAGKFVEANTKELHSGGYLHATYENLPEEVRSIPVNPDGTFEKRMLPGEVMLRAGVNDARLPENQAQKRLTLVDGQDQTDILFEVQQPLVFKGRVLGPDKKPVAGAKIVDKQGGSREPALSNKEGAFAIKLPSHVSFQNGSTYLLVLEATVPNKPDWRGVLIKTLAKEADLADDISLISAGSIQGKVLWEGTGAPVAFVAVIASPDMKKQQSNSEMHEQTETDATGAFVFKSVMPGNYTVKVERKIDGITTSRRIEMTTGTKLTDQDLVASKGVRITGKFVKADSREPASNVSLFGVSLKDPNSPIGFAVNADGTFEGRMLPGEVLLTANASKGRLDLGKRERRLTLVAGQDQADILFEVKPPLAFKGRVLDGEAKPVSGAKVVISENRSGLAATSDQEGNYEVTLPEYMNSNNTMDFSLSLEATHPAKPGLIGRITKKILNESELTGDITLVSTGGIQGKIIWEGSGEPVRQISVSVSPLIPPGDRSAAYANFKSQEPVRTDEAGAFNLKDLMPGKYTLNANMGNEGIVDSREVEVVPDSITSEQTLTASKGVLVSGKFVKMGTSELAGSGNLSVRYLNNTGVVTSIMVNPDGTFMKRLTPGEVSVHANNVNGVVKQNERNLKLVAGQDQTDLVFEVGAPLAFKGRVVGVDGKPIEGAKISSKQGGDNQIITSGNDGCFAMALPSYVSFLDHGSFTLVLEASHPDMPEARGIMIKELYREVDLSGDIIMAPAGSIEGKVVWEESGAPIGQVSVVAFPEHNSRLNNAGLNENTVTDDTGVFCLNKLLPGKYLLRLDAFRDGVIPIKSVEVQQGVKTTDRDLVVHKGVRITGKFIKADTREPVQNGNIQVHSPGALLPDSSLEMMPDGSFETRLDPGEAILIANVQNGYLPADQARKKLTLVAGQDQTDIVIEVKPQLVFKGRVLDTVGKPVAKSIVFYATGGNRDKVVSNKDGNFEIPIQLWMQNENEMSTSLGIKTSHPDKPDLCGFLFKTIKSEADLTGDIVLTSGGIIRGRVLDDAGKPLPAAIVTTTAINVNGQWMEDVHTVTDPSGQFEIKNTLVGVNYIITVTAEKYGIQYSRQKIEKPGEVRDLGDLVLPLANQIIEGIAKDESGKPLAAVDLNFNGKSSKQRSVRSDDQGRFRLENITEETGEIHAWYRDGDKRYRADSLAAGGDRDVELILIPEQPYSNAYEERRKTRLIDQKAPLLELSVWVNGEPATLESLCGTPVVLAFCKQEDKASDAVLAALVKIQEKFPKVSIVLIYNADTDQAALKKYVESRGITFRVAVDGAGVTLRKYKVHAPAVYLIGADGKIQYQDLALPVVETSLQSMLEGK